MVRHGCPGAAVPSGQSFGTCRAPAATLVFLYTTRLTQCRIDDAPRRFDRVFARKEQSVAMHRIADQTLVRIHPFAAFIAAIELDVPADHRGPRRLRPHAYGDGHTLGTELKSHIVGVRRDRLVEQVLRRALERDKHFGRGYRQAFSSSDEKWNARPPP